MISISPINNLWPSSYVTSFFTLGISTSNILKECASKYVCDATSERSSQSSEEITCFQRNLCNSAASITQNLLLLSWPFISYITLYWIQHSVKLLHSCVKSFTHFILIQTRKEYNTPKSQLYQCFSYCDILQVQKSHDTPTCWPKQEPLNRLFTQWVLQFSCD